MQNFHSIAMIIIGSVLGFLFFYSIYNLLDNNDKVWHKISAIFGLSIILSLDVIILTKTGILLKNNIPLQFIFCSFSLGGFAYILIYFVEKYRKSKINSDLGTQITI